MDLTCDWVGFQRTFHPKRKVSAETTPDSPVFALVDQSHLIEIVSESEDWAEWLGSSVEELKISLGSRTLHVIDRTQMESWYTGVIGQTHYYHQVQILRQSVGNYLKIHFDEKHFLLRTLRGWWKKVIPASFLLYIVLKGESEARFAILIRGGEIESFEEPDIGTLSDDRVKNPEFVVKYLSERYMLPVQSIITQKSDWDEWSQTEYPWRSIRKSLKEKRTVLIPRGFWFRPLFLLKAYLGI